MHLLNWQQKLEQQQQQGALLDSHTHFTNTVLGKLSNVATRPVNQLTFISLRQHTI